MIATMKQKVFRTIHNSRFFFIHFFQNDQFHCLVTTFYYTKSLNRACFAMFLCVFLGIKGHSRFLRLESLIKLRVDRRRTFCYLQLSTYLYIPLFTLENTLSLRINSWKFFTLCAHSPVDSTQAMGVCGVWTLSFLHLMF